MEVYDRVIKIVSPKRIKLREAQIELGLQMKRLSQKHQQLQQVLNSIFLKNPYSSWEIASNNPE